MKKLLILFFVSIFTLSACNDTTTNENTNESDTISITDREGNTVEIPTEIDTIVSTVPSNTEVLIALGLADKIVAVDTYSPIDELNEDIITMDFMSPDIEALLELSPDIIIASGHNKAIEDDPFLTLKEAGISVVYIPSSSSIEGVYDDILFIGEVTSEDSKAESIVDDMQDEIEQIQELASTIDEPKSVYFELGDYDGTLYSLGTDTFIHNILELIGATNVFEDQEAWLNVSAEDIIDRNPEVIITNNSSDNEAVDKIYNRAGFDSIDAVKDEQVFLVDSDATSRGSQNIIIGIKQIAEAVYPEIYEFETE